MGFSNYDAGNMLEKASGPSLIQFLRSVICCTFLFKTNWEFRPMTSFQSRVSKHYHQKERMSGTYQNTQFLIVPIRAAWPPHLTLDFKSLNKLSTDYSHDSR
jgi:hypothetical protein